MLKLLSFLLRCSRGIPRSRVMVFTIVLAGICTGLFNATLLGLINSFLNSHGSGSIRIAGFIALCVLVCLTRFVSEALLVYLSSATIFNLRMQICRNILSTPLRLLENLGAPRLMAALTDDIPIIGNALIHLPLLCMHGAVVVGCLAYLGYLSPVMLLCTLAFMSLGVISYRLPVKKALNHFKVARIERDALFNHFSSLTAGIKELKLHRQRRNVFVSDYLQSSADSFRRQHIAGNLVNIIARSWGHALFFVLLGLIVLVRPAMLETDSHVLTGYILTLLYMMTPVEVILDAIPLLGRASVAMDSLDEIELALASQTSENDSVDGTGRQFSQLELCGITHTYRREGNGDSFTLGPVNLKFAPGEVVFLAGGNGSGKTTLAKILIGLYVPESGEIRLDGQTITDVNREGYRQNFSVVFFDFYLFETFLGLDVPSLDETAREYLRRLHLDRRVDVKDGRLSTIELSQGQRKRLALLTAFLEDRSFYVFDEWAADQDPLFKEVFYLNLLPELKARGKTVLVITHDDKYYHAADRIIKLDYGAVVYDERAAIEQYSERTSRVESF